MPSVRVSIQEFPAHIYVVFYRDNKSIGPMRRYSTQERVMELLRRCHANLETINIVEMSLQARRPCVVEVNLTDEQIRKLSAA